MKRVLAGDLKARGRLRAAFIALSVLLLVSWVASLQCIFRFRQLTLERVQNTALLGNLTAALMATEQAESSLRQYSRGHHESDLGAFHADMVRARMAMTPVQENESGVANPSLLSWAPQLREIEDLFLQDLAAMDLALEDLQSGRSTSRNGGSAVVQSVLADTGTGQLLASTIGELETSIRLKISREHERATREFRVGAFWTILGAIDFLFIVFLAARSMTLTGRSENDIGQLDART